MSGTTELQMGCRVLTSQNSREFVGKLEGPRLVGFGAGGLSALALTGTSSGEESHALYRSLAARRPCWRGSHPARVRGPRRSSLGRRRGTAPAVPFAKKRYPRKRACSPPPPPVKGFLDHAASIDLPFKDFGELGAVKALGSRCSLGISREEPQVQDLQVQDLQQPNIMTG